MNYRLSGKTWAAMDSSRRYRELLEYQGAERPNELTELEEGRIRTTIAMIPPNVRTILDVGCRDGRVNQTTA